ncbi:hypothetical protein M378DRAFT_167728 [Amanita muscaria Koide BX008]|uniref:Protein kinase domain-containing protein n=1 Tax=Amanita muscaria (strain Koide BX008) TaxID=946122 RepID=A0A0C2WWM2_AMAMK|nr:hypothetical protein M378DRAFT_167728 [Amanita muscaria Koide BX008]
MSDYTPGISRRAVRLALEIHARVPVLPRSLFAKGIVGPHHHIWFTCRNTLPDTELLFQSAFVSKILDPSYIVRVLWVYEEDNRLLSVVDKVNENMESLSQWRNRSNPSSATRIRVMLEVAKAVRYVHSMGIILHDAVDSDDIFLDSEFHARFRFLGLTAHYINVTLIGDLNHEWLSREANIFLFGCLFYEMCFDVKISYRNRLENNSDAVAKRPSKPEIRDDEWQLIQRCCAKEPKSQPTMDEVVREMEAWPGI